LIVLRVIGWLLLLAALVVLGLDVASWIREGHWVMTPAGKLWYEISRNSLSLAQAGIERHVWKPLWDPVILTVLLQPAWLVLGLPGALLALFARHPRKRRRFGRS
jgi:ABC-type Fe3+ transport system permease subunit